MDAGMTAAWGWTTDVVDKPAILAAMRHSLRRWLERLGVQADLDELILVASELTTNAIEATRVPSDSIGVRAQIEGDRLVMAVANVGPVFVLPSTLPRDPTVARGRGLVIVRSLTDNVQVSQDGPNVVVSAWRRLQPPG